MLPREFAITTDTGEVYICTAPGEVVRLATMEQLNALLELSPEAYSALQELISLLGDQTVISGLLSDVQNLKSGDVKYNFSEAELRNNIDTTDNLKGILGKIKKWFSDLKAVALSGSYLDLIDAPTLGTAASKGVSNVLTQASEGYVLDARQGKALKDLISQLNSKSEYKTYSASNIHSDIGNNSIIVKANDYECKINGFMSLKAGTYNNTVLFKVPFTLSYVPYFSTTLVGRGFKISRDGEFCPNGLFTLDRDTYIYFNVSFVI